MNTIFSSNEPDPRKRVTRDAQKLDAAVIKSTKKNPAKRAESRNSETETAGSIQNRLYLRTGRTLEGLTAAKNLLETNTDGHKAGLDELVKQTRFQNERVLAEYAPLLSDIFGRNDRQGMDKLINDVSGRLHLLSREEIIRENLAAAASGNPDALVKEIVRSIKNGGMPAVSIARNRVLDLLK